MAETKLKPQSEETATMRLRSKKISAIRDLTAASGDVAYTGVGFIPTAILCVFGNTSTIIGTSMVDSSLAVGGMNQGSDGSGYSSDYFVQVVLGAGVNQVAIVKSFDADGFTLTWTKNGSPTGTLTLKFLCFR